MNDSKITIAIVVADFNKEIVDVMLEAANDEAKKLDVSVARIVRVPGAYEVPLVASVLLREGHICAVVVLGYIERGETQHGEVMGYAVHSSLLSSSLEYRKPIGMGIIGPGAVVQQAQVRKDSYARAAVRAAVATCRELHKLA